MTPKERILAAMRCEGVDYLPCSIYFNPNLAVEGYDLKDGNERVRLQLDLGVDPVVPMATPPSSHPNVKTRTWLEDVEGETCPILYKEYQTPAGTLRMGVRHGPDWPNGMEIPWDDYTASHLFEPLIKSPRDVDAFEHVWQPPTRADIASSRERCAEVLEFAKDKQLAVSGHAGNGLATPLFVMGAEKLVMFAMDHRKAFERLAEIDSRTNVERIQRCAEAGVDFVKRFGGYEQTNLFSPTIFREVLMPLLKREAQAAHDAGLLIYYRVVTGMEPLLEDIASVGFDCIEGGEPYLSNCSLETWHEAFAGKACSWTGISTPVLLGGKDSDAVRREVRHCVEVFGKTGFILGVTNSIRNNFPWQNTLAMVDEWKKMR